MSTKLILAFALTELFSALTPGPAVLLIVSQGMKAGLKSSIRGIVGIEIVNVLFFVLSALGLGAVLMASITTFHAIKWIGAAYLVFIGCKMLFFTRPESGEKEKAVPSRPALRFFTQGLITQATNPRAILFFAALLPQFVTPDKDVVKQFVMLGVVSIMVEVPVLLMFGWLSERGGRLIPERFALLPERVSGLLLIGAGAGLASMKRM
jgi:homoserine/homoserine lactone efflux protein